jgi:hypothetical protein
MLLLALLCSCGGLNQIRVEEVRNVQMKTLSGGTFEVGLEVKVHNPSCRKVRLTKLELDVERGGSLLATVSAKEKVSIPRRSDDFQPLPLEIRLRNLLAAVMAMQQKSFSVDDLTLSGEICVSAFPLSKKIKIKKQTVREFTAQYGDIITPLLNIRSR